MANKTIITSIGIPGSGKSYFFNNLELGDGYGNATVIRYSLTEDRIKVAGNINDASLDFEIKRQWYNDIKSKCTEADKSGQDIVFLIDSDNVWRSDRIGLAKCASANGCSLEMVMFNRSLDSYHCDKMIKSEIKNGVSRRSMIYTGADGTEVNMLPKYAKTYQGLVGMIIKSGKNVTDYFKCCEFDTLTNLDLSVSIIDIEGYTPCDGSWCNK